MAKLIVKDSPIHGKGMFAGEPIGKGTRIIEYLGERISTQEGDRRAEDGNVYIFNVNDDLDIDGSVNGNGSQYINHSCDGNSKWVIEGDRAFIDAVKDIEVGEELFYDYMLEGDELDPCGCGAVNCRKYMNNPKDIEKLKNKNV